MQQPAVGRVLNILLMLPVYMLLLLSAKRPGRVYWGLFVLVLLHAFQLVLLTIFSGSVVAVDMLLNIFTSEHELEGMEQDQHEEPPVDTPRTLRREQEKHVHR